MPRVWKVASPTASLLCASPEIARKWADAVELETGFAERVLVYEVLVHDGDPERDPQGRLVWSKD